MGSPGWRGHRIEAIHLKPGGRNLPQRRDQRLREGRPLGACPGGAGADEVSGPCHGGDALGRGQRLRHGAPLAGGALGAAGAEASAWEPQLRGQRQRGHQRRHQRLCEGVGIGAAAAAAHACRGFAARPCQLQCCAFCLQALLARGFGSLLARCTNFGGPCVDLLNNSHFCIGLWSVGAPSRWRQIVDLLASIRCRGLEKDALPAELFVYVCLKDSIGRSWNFQSST